MDPSLAIRYPRGGDPVWTEDSLASDLLRGEFFSAEAPAGTDASADGATLSFSTTFVAGGATSTRSATAAGATLTVTRALSPGAATAQRNATAAGVILGSTLSLATGAVTLSQNATGAALTSTFSFLPGAATAVNGASADGATYSIGFTFAPGAATATRSASVTGIALNTSVALLPGSAVATRSAAAPGATLSTAFALDAGTAAATRGATAAGAALDWPLALAAGEATTSIDASADGVDLAVSFSYAPGATQLDAAAAGATLLFGGGTSYTGCRTTAVVTAHRVEAIVSSTPSSTVKIVTVSPTVRVNAPRVVVGTVVNTPQVAVVTPTRPQVIIDGDGLQGPPGETEGAVFNVNVGEPITSGRVVRIENGLLFQVDTSVPAHGEQVIGIAAQSATVLGQPCAVRNAGNFTEAAWNWAPGLVYCGPAGEITQAPSDTGWLVQIGRVVSATTIAVDPEPVIQR